MPEQSMPTIETKAENASPFAIRRIVDQTRGGIHAVSSELVDMTGATTNFALDAGGHLTGRLIRSIGTMSRQFIHGLMGHRFYGIDPHTGA